MAHSTAWLPVWPVGIEVTKALAYCWVTVQRVHCGDDAKRWRTGQAVL